MSEILSVVEIENRFPSEWVLIGDPEVNEYFEVLRGRVLWHSKDRDEVTQKAIELRPKSSAIRFMGQFPQDMEYIL